MVEIKDLLGKFDRLLFSQESARSAVRAVFSKILDLEIDSQKIKIKNQTIFLDIKPIYKNEIFLKQDKIIFELQKVLGGEILKK